MRGHDHRLARDAAGPRHLLLHRRHFLQWHLHTEIAACNHQRVGKIDDFREPLHGLRLLDLGHHSRASPGDFFCLRNILRPLDERQRYPVDAGFKRSIEIRTIFLGERRERNGRVRQAHTLSVGQLAADDDSGGNALWFGLGHGKLDLAVINQKRMSWLDGGEDFRMRQICARCITRRGVGIEHEGVAAFHDHRTTGEGP